MPDSARPGLRSWTVRSRIVGILTLLSLLTVFAAGGVAYLSERTRVVEQIDTNLDAALESAGFVVGEQQWGSVDEALTAVVQRLAPDDNTGAVGIIDGRAALVPGIQTDVRLEVLPGFVDRMVAETAGHQVVMGTYAQDGRTVRYLAAPVSLGAVDEAVPPQAIFATGYDVAAELAELDEAARVFTVTASVATAVTFLIGLVVSDRLLRPVRRIREVAERSSAASLAERIPVGSSRDDVSQLAITVNGMLDRLGGALDSQRELLRDVGHELKTPITIVRGHLELVDARDPAEVAEVRDLAIDELDRMARLVDDLRAAARLQDPGAFALQTTDASALVASIALKASAIEGAVIDEAVDAAAVQARLDPDRIAQAMLQLVANAVRHAQGPITIGSRVRHDVLELFVRDRGPGVPDALKSAIFERFTRGEAAGRGDGGSGLGLAIVKIIAEGHDGTALVVDAGGGSEFRIVLPGAVVAADAQATDAHAAPSGSRTTDRTSDSSTPSPEEQPWHRS